MLRRKIAATIREHLSSHSERILLIDGARQIGKSYIIRQVGQELFPNYIELNMEEDKLQDRLFAEARTVADFYMSLSVVAGDKMGSREDTLIFIDEIQAYDHLLTLLKFLNADRRFTFVASGSMLGVALRQTSSLPVGSIRMEHMFPMDFEEFLWANGVGEEVIRGMQQACEAQRTLPPALHNKMIDLLHKYLLVGGMPAAVDIYVREQNIQQVRSIQSDINMMYGIDASKYEEVLNRRLKIRRILEMIPSSLENKKKRIVYADIEDKKWKRADHYTDEFDYLIAAGVVLEVKAISQPTYPLIENSGKNLLKLYLNDVGILSGIYFRQNIMAVMQDVCGLNLGAVYESFVAQELRAHGHALYYYDNKKVGEVDFLTDSAEDLSVVPIEVKSGKDYTIHSALNRFLSVKDYAVRRAYVLSNAPEVRTVDGITYMPIYNLMFLQ
jgi:hypothetical protein